MTRKDFELIASTVKQSIDNADHDSVKQQGAIDVAHRFASRLRSTNPNFDSARFLKACGVSA